MYWRLATNARPSDRPLIRRRNRLFRSAVRTFSTAKTPIDPTSKRLAFLLKSRDTTKPFTSEANVWNRETEARAASTEAERPFSFPPAATARIALNSLLRAKRAASSMFAMAEASAPWNESASFAASEFATAPPPHQRLSPDKRLGSDPHRRSVARWIPRVSPGAQYG